MLLRFDNKCILFQHNRAQDQRAVSIILFQNKVVKKKENDFNCMCFLTQNGECECRQCVRCVLYRTISVFYGLWSG